MLKKLLTTKKLLFAALMLVAGINTWGQINEGFETNGSSDPAGWTNTSITYNTNNPRTGTRSAVFNATNDEMITPLIATPNALSFWYRRSGTSPGTPTFTVYRGTSVSGPWTQVGSTITNFTTTYQQFTADLSSFSNIYIRILHTRSSGSNEIYLDDFSVTVPTGPAVTTGTAGTVTATTAVLNGSANANGSSTVALYFDYGTTTSYGSQVLSTTPSSTTGTTAQAFTGTATGLTPNTTYNFRAAGTNGTVYNGSNATFVTLANVPGAPAISGATTTSLSVTLNSTTQNSNPATTTYAIQVTNTNQYVQTNGSLGASAVWATAATWGTKVVTGLTSNTQYTFQVKARNGATTPVETAFGATASGTTLAATAPLLSAGTITTFGSVCINTTATPDKSFILDGDNLTGDVTVGPLAGFTFSTTSNGTFTPSLTLTPVAGEVLTDIFVRFTPTAVQSYDGNIVISGGGASSINVAAAGSGVNTSATVTTAAAISITSATATLGGNVTVQGCGTVTRGVVYATSTNPAVGGIGVTNLSGGTGTGAFTVNATGLTTGVTYYARAYATNNAGTVYGSQVSFTTTPANDLCVDAVTLTVNAAATNGTLAGATYTTFTNGNNQKDVWYKFTASCSGNHTITLAGFSGDADIYLFSGSTCPTNNNNAVAFSATANTPEVVTYSVTSGVNYYIRVAAWDVTAESSAFTIRVQSTDAVPTVTTTTASAITYQSATVPGTAVVAGCSSAVGTTYGIYYSTTNGFADGDGTQVPGTNLSGTTFSVNLSGLTPLTTYYYKAYAANAAGTGYSTQGSFTTAAFVLSGSCSYCTNKYYHNRFYSQLGAGIRSYKLQA